MSADGIGPFFQGLRMAGELEEIDLFASKAASEVARMYRQKLKLPKRARVFGDMTAGAAPVGLFYYGDYHTLIVAPATSKTVAKCAFGSSQTLVTNVFAKTGKCRVPAIVFACDAAPELGTEALKGRVKVYPRQIDLQNTERLKSFESTTKVEPLEQLERALQRRWRELHG